MPASGRLLAELRISVNPQVFLPDNQFISLRFAVSTQAAFGYLAL
jgi:hypothetical protein